MTQAGRDRTKQIMFDHDLGTALLESARRHADRPALWVLGDRFTYRELFERAATWSVGLRSAGLPVGSRVCILAARSATAYTGVLAALLAGCTYVPLNTRFPPARNRDILVAADADAVILDDESAGTLSTLIGDFGKRVLLLTPESDEARVPEGNSRVTYSDLSAASLDSIELPASIDRDALAYLIFTSGTTGIPKGVPISHHNVDGYISATHTLIPLNDHDRVLQSADLSFDQSVHDMFLTWLSGSELYVAPENASILAPRLIAQHELTACHFVPSIAARSLELGLLRPDCMPTLRYTAFGGEALPVSIIQPWATAAPNSALFNFYGPTEGTVYFSCYRINPRDTFDMAVAFIGWPLGDQRISLFDETGTIVDTSDTGEICLSGSQLMKGYWRAPGLDDEKFITIDDTRWYKTGDLGRIVEPHGMAFAGRADRQVKLRGYRVELQEIEGVLRRTSGREQVAVIAWPLISDGVADDCIGFIVGEGDAAALRTACRKSLPPYMVPSQILFVTQLPLNVNGKTDYKALYKHDALEKLANA